jgi:hypothetical protein
VVYGGRHVPTLRGALRFGSTRTNRRGWIARNANGFPANSETNTYSQEERVRALRLRGVECRAPRCSLTRERAT